MNLQDYEKLGFELYKAFTNFLTKKMERAIKEAGKERGKKFRLQTIKKRAKSVPSLRQKLKDRELENIGNIEEEIKDLAGCRLVFYYDDDVSTFLNSRLLDALFKVDRDESKIFFPSRKTDSPNQQYTAIHYLVSLKEENCSSEEIKKFGELRAEIQIHTVLTDVWADAAHPITYKKRFLPKGFGAKQYEALEKRVERVMTKHLRPAGLEFQKIWNDLEKLEAGKNLIEQGFLKELGSDIDNNQRFEILEGYKDFVLDVYDDYQKAIDEIIKVAQTAFNKSRDYETKPIETPYGNLPGKTQKDVLEKCLEILRYVWKVDFELVFSVAVEFYSTANEPQELKAIEDFVSKIAKFDLNVLKQAGVVVQSSLMNQVSGWDENTLIENSGLVRTVCQAVLNPTAEGLEYSYKSVGISTVGIIATKEVTSVRTLAIKILTKLFCLTSDPKEKEALIIALEEASRRSHRGNPGEEFEEMLANNVLDVLSFYKGIIKSETLPILQKIRNSCHTMDWVISDGSVRKLALEIRDEIEGDPEFKIFDTLIGYRDVFRPWSDQPSDQEEGWYNKVEEERKQLAKLYAEQITPENFGDWKTRIHNICKFSSSEKTDFYLFRVFLEHAALSSPSLLFEFLETDSENIEGFLAPIFSGLLKSGERDKASAFLKRFIKKGKFLDHAGWALRFEGCFDHDLALCILKAATKAKKCNPINHLFAGLVENWEENTELLKKQLFIPGLKFLTSEKNTGWVDATYFIKKNKDFLAILGEKEFDLILANLIFAPKIDYHHEKILIPIAEKFPEKVIQFFGKRLRFKPKEENIERYEPCPYKFHSLHNLLAESPALVTITVRGWFDGDWGAFTYDGAYFLSRVFPDFSEKFQKELVKLLNKGGEGNVDFVLSVVGEYKGQGFLNDICKKIVKTLDEESEKLQSVERALEQTGISTGVFGRAEKYEAKKEEFKEWLEDEDPKVRAFATSYIQSLDNSIARETKWATEDEEMQKHEWGYDEEE